MLLWALILAAPAVEQPTLHLEAGTVTATLSARLRRERPELKEVSTASIADLRVRLRVSQDVWQLSADDRYDVPRARRDLPAKQPQAALRQAVIVILGILDRLEEAPPTPPPPPVASARSSVVPAGAWYVGLQGATELWASAATVRLGAGVWVLRDLGPVQVGLALRFAGPCCEAQTSELRGTHIDGAVGARVRLADWWSPTWGWAIDATAGLRAGRLTAEATVFQGQAVPESRNAVGFEAEGAGTLRLALTSGLSANATLGARLMAPRVRLVLPQPFTGDALDTGFFAPWLRIGLEATLF